MVRVNSDAEDPSLEVLRYSFGNKSEFTDNGIVDRYIIRKNSRAPETPAIIDSVQKEDMLHINSTPYENDEATYQLK